MQLQTGLPKASSWSGNKIFQAPPSKGRLGKNLYTWSETLTLNCKVTLAWARRVNLYDGPIMIVLRKTKTYTTRLGPGHSSGPADTGNLYQFPHPLISIAYNISHIHLWNNIQLRNKSSQSGLYFMAFITSITYKYTFIPIKLLIKCWSTDIIPQFCISVDLTVLLQFMFKFLNALSQQWYLLLMSRIFILHL